MSTAEVYARALSEINRLSHELAQALAENARLRASAHATVPDAPDPLPVPVPGNR